MRDAFATLSGDAPFRYIRIHRRESEAHLILVDGNPIIYLVENRHPLLLIIDAIDFFYVSRHRLGVVAIWADRFVRTHIKTILVVDAEVDSLEVRTAIPPGVAIEFFWLENFHSLNVKLSVVRGVIILYWIFIIRCRCWRYCTGSGACIRHITTKDVSS